MQMHTLMRPTAQQCNPNTTIIVFCAISRRRFTLLDHFVSSSRGGLLAHRPACTALHVAILVSSSPLYLPCAAAMIFVTSHERASSISL